MTDKKELNKEELEQISGGFLRSGQDTREAEYLAKYTRKVNYNDLFMCCGIPMFFKPKDSKEIWFFGKYNNIEGGNVEKKIIANVHIEDSQYICEENHIDLNLLEFDCYIE